MKKFLKKYYLKLEALRIYRAIRVFLCGMFYRGKEKFKCPVCGYRGPFIDMKTGTGPRKHSRCPNCGSLERHRLQYLVVNKIAETHDLSRMSILHFAPEPLLKELFQKLFNEYTSADLCADGVDFQADLRALPFEDSKYDFVYASHVLEHIKEDASALSEIIRVLRPNGIAVLPVPIVAEATVEYPEANPAEAGHVRAPGPDYYEKYRDFFSRVDIYYSGDFPEEYQTYAYGDRSKWPKSMPLRPTMAGTRHSDAVPVAFL